MKTVAWKPATLNIKAADFDEEPCLDCQEPPADEANSSLACDQTLGVGCERVNQKFASSPCGFLAMSLWPEPYWASEPGLL
jgi:hypothetical protein